jgi:predicted GNAT family acetyltransferase
MTSTKIERLSSPTEFLSRAGYTLASDEARWGLIYGIAKRLVDNPHAYGNFDPWFLVVSDDKGLCAVAMRTPPFKVLLAHFSGDLESVAMVLTDSISQLCDTVPGIVGDIEIADHFTEHWALKHRIKIKGKMAQRLYRLRRVNPVRLSSGKLRLATIGDKRLLTKWAHSFHEDVFLSANTDMPEDDINPRIDKGEVYLWEDDVPVSMAATTRPTENGISISFVYTPPSLRRKGYATSCVAMLSKELLRTGYKFCTLYADLSNPTSNSIYKNIGFEEVCDSVEYTFSTLG